MPIFLAVKHQPSGGREWVARLMGRDPKFNFKREFLKPVRREWSLTGRTGATIFALEDGIYEVNEPYRPRWYVEVKDGKWKEIKLEDVFERLPK